VLLTGGVAKVEGSARIPHVKIASVKEIDVPLLTRWVRDVAQAAAAG
jgi:hypothetical protein